MEDAAADGFDEASQELAASQVNPSCSHDRDRVTAARDDVGQLSGSFERFSVDDDTVDGNVPDRSLPSSPTRSPEIVSRILLPRHVNPLSVEERPAFVEYVLSLMDDPVLLDVNAVGADAAQQKRRDHCCSHLKQRFTINDRDANRLLQISYLVHLRFRAGDSGEACEHVHFAGLAGRVVHENDMLISKHKPDVRGPSKQAGSRVVNETPVPQHRSAKAPALPSGPQSSAPPLFSSALERSLASVYAHLRSHLPASQAEATILAMEQNRIGGHTAPLPNAPLAEPSPADPAVLGHGYRIGAAVGQLAREHLQFQGRMQQLGARLNSRDAPESHMFPSDRMARFNPENQRVLGTLRKVVEGHGEFKHLNSKQKIRAMSRLVREQLHQASLVPIKSKAEGDDGDGDDDSSVSTGDSCGSKAADSRASEESYQRDSFCASDSSRTQSISVDSNRGGSPGGGGDGADGSSSEGSNSDSEDGDEKRANMRKHSFNSLGTPKKKSSPVEKLTKRQLQKLPNSTAARQQLVLLGNEDLPMWKIGSAKYKNGFSWESYLHHKQAFDNYMAHRGRFSERTFKSVIHANLVPAVCASCGFSRSKWSLVSDSRLILRIERVLRPSRSTDFAMELKGLKITREGDETLQASYSSFAEKFLSKIAEAEDAGRPIKSVVVKAAFKSAIDKEVALKTWFEGDRWRGVNHAHARLLRKLREARSWEAISKSVLKAKIPASNRDDAHDTSDQASEAPAGYRRAPRRRSNHTSKAAGGKGKGKSGNRLRSGGRDRDDRRGSSNSTRKRFNSTNDRNAHSKRADKGESKRSWQGYDDRGESWHTDCNLFECYKRPCNAPFCQRCAKHGHTAETCRVPDGVDGLNSNGYFQEKRPGKVGPKRPPPRVNNTGKRRQGDDGDDDDSGRDSEDEGSEHQATRSRSNNTGKAGSRGKNCRSCL